MAEREVLPNALFNPSENTEVCMDQINILPNLGPIPNYGLLFWEFSHPEEPLDLNTLPGYENIVYHAYDIQPTPCVDALTVNEICHTEVNREAMDLNMMTDFGMITMDAANPTSFDNASPALIDGVLFHAEVANSDTDWQIVNELTYSVKMEERAIAGKSLRNHPFLTAENLHSLAIKRLEVFNLKPGHIIKFVYYGLGILHPTFSLNTCVKKDSYTCGECSNTFRWKSEYQTHSLSHSGGFKSILCISCPKDFWNLHELIRHSRIHNNHLPFKCGICGNMFKHKDSLFVHLGNIHNFAVSDTEKRRKNYLCPECYVACDTTAKLKMHVRSVHQVEECFDMNI